MWCKQHPTCALLQYLRQPTINCPISQAPPDELYSASRPTILSLPVSRELLGGRANKQDKQQAQRDAPTRHRRFGRLDSLRRVHRRNSRLYRRNPRLGRTRTVRDRPRPQYYTSSHILHRRDRGHDIRILLRLGLRCLIEAWRLSRGPVRHRIFDRRRNLRTLRSPPHILPPEKQWPHATLDSLRNIDILGLVNIFILPFGTGGFWTLYFGTGVALFTGFPAAIPAALYGTAFYLAREESFVTKYRHQ